MADPKGYYLSEGDRKALTELLREHRQRPPNATNRPDPEGEDWFTPEVYIAKTPPEGIPALVEGPDTGTELGEGDEPGFADCDIYRIITFSGNPELVPVSGLSKRVYNLTPDSPDESTTGTADVISGAVAGNIWIPVARDKFGSWMALTGAGGGSVGAGFDYVLANASGTSVSGTVQTWNGSAWVDGEATTLKGSNAGSMISGVRYPAVSQGGHHITPCDWTQSQTVLTDDACTVKTLRLPKWIGVV